MKEKNEKVVMALLISLGGVNVLFYISSHSSGPLIGICILTIFSLLWWRKKRYQPIIILATIWIGIHIFELVLFSVDSYPLFVSLNILLPIPLLYFGIRDYTNR